MNIKYDMVVDFARPSKSNTITISEDDSYSRQIVFTLLANKQEFDMSDVASAIMRGVRQDGSVIFGDAFIVKDENENPVNKLVYTLPGTISEVAGRVTMTITLNGNGGEKITSFEFYVDVRNALYNEDDYIADDDLSGFQDLLNRTLAALAQIEILVKREALPNPYALTITLDGEDNAYNGAAPMQIDFGETVRISSDGSEETESVEDTTVAQAITLMQQVADSLNQIQTDINNIKEEIRTLGGDI